MNGFMSPAPRWAQRIATAFGLVISTIFLVQAYDQFLRPGTEGRATDIAILAMGVVIFATFAAGFTAVWLKAKP